MIRYNRGVVITVVVVITEEVNCCVYYEKSWPDTACKLRRLRVSAPGVSV